MAYEIPQDLRYKERVFFGLTFSQLTWLALFGGLAAVVFFKLPWAFPAKALVSSILLVLALGFAFLGFYGYLTDWMAYKGSIRLAGFLDAATHAFLGVEKVEGDAVYLLDGSVRGVLSVQPLNFSLLSQAQQKAVIAAFRAFLDSLDFPVQIVMRTVNLELGGYLQSLDARLASAGPEMAEEVQSFKSFVRELIEKKSVKNRLFYVVIPFSPANSSNALADALVNLERFVFGASSRKTSFEVNNELALNQLGVRLKLCGEKLTRCGLVCGRLDSAQLVALLASYFEDFVVAGSDYLFPVTMLEGFEAGREARA